MDHSQPPERYIGLMSGTSLDGVDGALCEFEADGAWRGVVRHAWRPFDPALREALWTLQHSGADELHRAALAGNALARVYSDVCKDLLGPEPDSSPRVKAIGAHGQTVRHQPARHDGIGYTSQLLAPALLAELSGIDVVADLRSADVAAGGQGAPLVPPFHAAMFGQVDHEVVVVNIGGISNLTLLKPSHPPRGFDCGPGNALMDHWVSRHLGVPFDRDGAWGASGRVDEALLAQWLGDPYFALPPPKSTGRDLFNPTWLTVRLPSALAQPPEDIQATLCVLTAQAIVNDVRRWAPTARTLRVCGGGAYNAALMQRLEAALPEMTVTTTDAAGLPADQVEAAAFAWLARMFMHRLPAGVPAVTGAARPKILGALYPA